MSEHYNLEKRKKILDMIVCAEYEDLAFVNRLLDNSSESQKTFSYWINWFVEKKTENALENLDQCYRIIVDAATEYVLGYPAPATAKQKLYQQMYALCETIGERYGVERYEGILKELPIPVDQDLTIGIVKDLHTRNGITKSEIAAEYGVSRKTAQTMIHRLSGEYKEKPIRIGGQIVHINIGLHAKEGRDSEQRFYTPDSMSPIVLQMNLMQVATLLQSFYYNFEKGNVIPLDMAISVWYQLSDYAKTRIKEIFCRRDFEFAGFIDIVDKESESEEYRYFMTESEMLDLGNANATEQLVLAFKGSVVCDLVLTGPHRSWKRKRIFYDFEKNCYYAVSADDLNGEKLYFKEEELYKLAESLD